MRRIVILGGGNGGLSVARALRFVPVEITLIDRRATHLFQSRLYTAAVSSARRLHADFEILLAGQQNVEPARGEAVYLDAHRRRLILTDRAVAYDVLVVAAGARPRYDREEWARLAPGVHSVDQIREKLRDSATSAIIIGAGTTGVELAAAAARADHSRRVVLLESGERILPAFPPELAAEAAKALCRLGIEIRANAHVIGIDSDNVRISGTQGRERILTRAALWTGGVRASGFGAALRSETGATLDGQGRVCVQPDLTVSGHPEIFVIGDMARVVHEGVPLEGLATVAAQQGRYVAAAIRERLAGYDIRPFQYVDQGRYALIGRGGVGVIGETDLRGATAWLAAKLAQKWSEPGTLLRTYSAATGSRI